MADTPEQVVARLSAVDARSYAEMLERLAMHMSDRINYAEGRRASLSTNGVGILAAGIAILALVKDTGFVEVPLIVLSIGLILTGLATLTLYVRQTNFKTFLQVASLTKPWKWFYRDALIDPSQLTAGRFTFQTAEQLASAAQAFDQQWPEFAQRFLQVTDPHIDATQNLRQVYVLHANEKYKNQHLSELRTVFNKGIIASGIAFLVILVLVLGVSLVGSLGPRSHPTKASATPSSVTTPHTSPSPPKTPRSP